MSVTVADIKEAIDRARAAADPLPPGQCLAPGCDYVEPDPHPDCYYLCPKHIAEIRDRFMRPYAYAKT